MIKVTRLNGKELFVNCELIEFVESTPDTVITLINEKKMVVTEPVETVIERIVNFKLRTTALPSGQAIYRDEV